MSYHRPLKPNTIMDTDSYKFSHYLQYPEKSEIMHCYFSSRGGRWPTVLANIGLQYQLLEYLTRPITMLDVEEAAAFAPKHGVPFPYEGWKKVVTHYSGYLPVRIHAIPEGTEVPVNTPTFTVESVEDPDVFFVAGWIETQLTRVWYPVTVATQGFYIKKIVHDALLRSSDNPELELEFKVHCFGGRGATCREAAGIGGMAHLANFRGSDTVEGIRFANHYYNEEMAGFSIPAAEHSTASAWGRKGELNFMRHMVKTFLAPGKMASCVSDTWDVFYATENYWGKELLDDVKASGGTLVIRPDSGEPVDVVLKILRTLEDRVGMARNSKGYKVLPSYYRLIQGDGVNIDSIKEILDTMLKNGYSASNIAFGMGGAGLQKVDRDTQKHVYKNSWMRIDGESVDIYKDPITDPGKTSKKGRQTLGYGATCVYDVGKLPVTYSFAQVRERANKSFFSHFEKVA